MARPSPFHLLLLLLLPFLLLPQNVIGVIISGQQQSESSAIDAGWWTVDRSPPSINPKDAWWTGCKNRTSEDQRNVTLAHVINTQACLDWYYWGGLKDSWVGMVCNGFGFFRGTADGYFDSAACYEKCYGCLTESIQAGSVTAMCRDGHGRGVSGVLGGNDAEPTK